MESFRKYIWKVVHIYQHNSHDRHMTSSTVAVSPLKWQIPQLPLKLNEPSNQ